MSALWTSAEIAEATGGTASAPFEVTGVTFDSREVGPGDLFVAMPGTVHDGHTFVEAAFAAGAAAAIVSQPVDGPHVLVGDTFEALRALGRAARERSSATILGVTGSVGKTSTKEALFAALTALIRPHLALITAIAPAHIENLGSEEAIADAKAEIFAGLEPDGIAIVPNDTPHRDRLVKAARRHADRIITFGGGDADVYAVHAVTAEGGGSLISAALLERELTFTISQRGEHWVSNALAVLAAVEAVGEDVAVAGLALADLGGLKGRGERHVIHVAGGEVLLLDESYNANPASMAATLKSLGAEKDVARRIAVLGPMRELGEHSDALHAGLAPAVLDAHVEELILIGDEMRPLAEQVVGKLSLDLVASVEEATELLKRSLRPGDAVLVKASNSVGLAKLVERMVKGAPCST